MGEGRRRWCDGRSDTGVDCKESDNASTTGSVAVPREWFMEMQPSSDRKGKQLPASCLGW